MAIVKVYRNGLTVGTAPGKNDHIRAKRDVITGWSAGAVRRHTAWLKSIDADQLDGVGFALTLTLKTCPSSAAEWQALRRAVSMRFIRRGASRIHWVVEWQRRKVPHLHMAVYFPADADVLREVPALARYSWRPPSERPAAQVDGPISISAPTLFPPASEASALAPSDRMIRIVGTELIADWLVIAEEFGAASWSQTALPIDGPLGWFKYLSKHAARGAQHYQRQGAPEGWESTGRLWGHQGAWPVEDPQRFQLSGAGMVRLRRLMRSWRIADARLEKDPQKRAQRVRAARRCLRSSDRNLSSVRGLSEWVPNDVSFALMLLISSEGYELTQR